MRETIVIGIDCATKAQATGIAIGRFNPDGSRLSLVNAFCDANQEWPELCAKYVSDITPALLCLDCPLGWPKALSDSLFGQLAGEYSFGSYSLDELFSRETDRDIARRYKKPLEVGADRIARTAVVTLRQLERFRSLTGREFKLGWGGLNKNETAVIEVYPAATRLSHGLPRADKRSKDVSAERAAIERLFSSTGEALWGNPDVRDAILCLIAGADYLRGECLAPLKPLSSEGWIWVRG
jgi:hypothetical protein